MSGLWPFSRFPTWYPRLLRAHALPWRLTYWLTNHRLMVRALSRLCLPYVRPALQRLLTRYEADVIVSFHPIPNHVLALVRREWSRPPLLATVVLDFGSAPVFWFANDIDLFSVPYADVAARARRLGVDATRIEVLGMPVRREIVRGVGIDKGQARQTLGVDPARPLVLLLGGGEGVGPLEALTQALLQKKPPATIAVIAGRNRPLQARLARLASGQPTIRVEGFSTEMALWLRAADILVSKAGPNSLAEAFVMGLPTVLYAAVPGQEEGNVRLVQQAGAGVWAPGARRSSEAVLALLADPARRARMAQQAARLATPDAAPRIAERLWRLAHNK